MPRKSSKGNGRRNPTKYRRSAVKYNPSFVLGKIVVWGKGFNSLLQIYAMEIMQTSLLP